MMRQVTHAGWVLVLAAAGMAGGCSRSVPWGWKVTSDPSGSCQVATPGDWQLGREFFLKVEKADPGPMAHGSQRLPPQGLALWGIDGADRQKVAPVPVGKRFQLRTSVVRGEAVCSVWRIKETVDFTDEERSTMTRVGKTLRWVR
jgi:hypothetical protein